MLVPPASVRRRALLAGSLRTDLDAGYGYAQTATAYRLTPARRSKRPCQGTSGQLAPVQHESAVDHMRRLQTRELVDGKTLRISAEVQRAEPRVAAAEGNRIEQQGRGGAV